MTDAESIDVIVLEPTDIGYLQQLAAEHQVKIEVLPRSGLEPVTTIAISISGAAFAVATVVYLLDKFKGGQVIDLRPGAPATVYRSREVIYGLVVILTPEGTVNVLVREPKGMFGHVNELMTGLLGELGGKGIDAVADVIKDRLPADTATISSTPA